MVTTFNNIINDNNHVLMDLSNVYDELNIRGSHTDENRQFLEQEMIGMCSLPILFRLNRIH